MFPASSHRRAGFTLIEMSIVLIIIALLAGGALLATQAMRNTRIYKITDQYSNYVQAIELFKKKYNAIPGDMVNATDIWAASTNGNGDGRVGSFNNDSGYYNNFGETFGFWQQLALAGFIQGTYTGAAGPGGAADSIFGTNQPASSISGTGWFAQDLIDTSATNGSQQYKVFNGLILTVAQDDSAAISTRQLLTPEEMLLLDQKTDDGRPGSGHLIANNGLSLICTTTTDPETAAYKTTETRAYCSPVFKVE